MFSLTLNQKLADAKSSLSCIELLNNLGFRCRNGQAIITPSFIRNNDHHPSFGTWDTGCKDFATGEYYDIFSLYMLAHDCSLAQAYQALTGDNLFPHHQHNFSSSPVAKLVDALAADPIVNLTSRRHLLSDLLQSLGVPVVTTEPDLWGYDPQSRTIFAPAVYAQHTANLLNYTSLHVSHNTPSPEQHNSLLADPVISFSRNVHILSEFLPSFGINHDNAKRLGLGFSADIFSFVVSAQHFKEAANLLKDSPIPVVKVFDDDDFAIITARAQLLHNINRWHKTLLEDPIVNYKGSDIHLASEYLAKRGINRDTINRLQIGYNPNTHRLIFPLFKGSQPVYFIGRDMTGKYEAGSKYIKAKKDDSIAYESTFWGRETIRKPGTKTLENFTAPDGETYSFDKDDPRDYTLIIVEGMLDYASFVQDGWQVLSPGCGYFSQKDMREVLDIAASFKNVCLCFDNDKAGLKFTHHLSQVLLEHRIHFSVVHTANPDGSEGKYDINDYYAAGGSLEVLVSQAKNGIADFINSFDDEAKIWEYLEQASRWISPVDMGRIQDAVFAAVKPNPFYNPNDKVSEPFEPKFNKLVLRRIFRDIERPVPEKRIAEEVLKRYHLIYNYNDSFYLFDAGRWQPVPEIKVFQMASDRLGSRAGAGKCRAIVTHLKGLAGDWAQFDTQHIIAFKNGVLDLEDGTFSRHDPKFMNTIILDYPYMPTAPCRKWRRFIEQVSKNRQDVMRQLQKAAGYVLFADNRLHKMFALFGSGANGKSVFTGVIEQVYGSQNTSHVRPDRLSNEFEGILTKGKLLNVSSETKPKLADAEAILKAIISGDPITSAHKGVDAVSFTPRAKWFINLNETLETTDISWGFIRRLIFLPFDANFNGKDANPNLMDELLEELPGIFNWCYEGYKMLREDMRFEDLEGHTKIMEAMMSRVNSTFSFFCDACRGDFNDYFKDVDEQRYYPNDVDLYKRYKAWCLDSNEKPDTRKMFVERFRVLLQKYRPDVVISEPMSLPNVRGKVCNYYFPEFIPSNDEDYFADVRNENGEVLAKSEQVDPQALTEEVIDAISQVDADPNDEGRKLFQECVVKKDWARQFMPDPYASSSYQNKGSLRFAALCRYLRANPQKAGELYNFKETFKKITGYDWTD